MFARTLIVAGGLVLALVGAAAAQTVVTGTVTRIDQPASVIVLQDGRMVRVPGGTVLINGQPMAISTIQPGTLVAIQNGQAVTYQNGVYVPADPRRVPYEVSGRVTLIDSVENVLVLDGLRPIALTPDMQVFQDGRQVEQDISIRAYSLHELGKLLRQAGFRVQDVSGSLATKGHFFGATSRNIIMVCERPTG